MIFLKFRSKGFEKDLKSKDEPKEVVLKDLESLEHCVSKIGFNNENLCTNLSAELIKIAFRVNFESHSNDSRFIVESSFTRNKFFSKKKIVNTLSTWQCLPT